MHWATEQVPAVHAVAASGAEHTRPQAPQLLGSVDVVAHVVPQSVVPAAHVSVAGAESAPPSSPWKPTLTVVSPFGRRVSAIGATCWAVSEAWVAALIQVACVCDVTAAHAPGYASPTNVSRPRGSPVIERTELCPDVTSKRLVTLRAPVTSISIQPTWVGTWLIAAVARPTSSPSGAPELQAMAASEEQAKTTAKDR